LLGELPGVGPGRAQQSPRHMATHRANLVLVACGGLECLENLGIATVHGSGEQNANGVGAAVARDVDSPGGGPMNVLVVGNQDGRESAAAGQTTGEGCPVVGRKVIGATGTIELVGQTTPELPTEFEIPGELRMEGFEEFAAILDRKFGEQFDKPVLSGLPD